jgi:hypothetical protein
MCTACGAMSQPCCGTGTNRTCSGGLMCLQPVGGMAADARCSSL